MEKYCPQVFLINKIYLLNYSRCIFISAIKMASFVCETLQTKFIY